MANYTPNYRYDTQVIHICKQCGSKTQWRHGFESSHISCTSCGAPLSTDTLLNPNCLVADITYDNSSNTYADSSVGSSSEGIGFFGWVVILTILGVLMI